MNGDSSTPRSAASHHDEESVEETRLHDMDGRNHVETQETISSASLGLTDALHRLQHLRNSLAELTDGSNRGVGPAHRAIVLSDATVEDGNAVPDMQRLRSTIPSTIMERLEAYEADSRYRSEGGFTSGTLRTPISQQSSNSPSLPSSPAQTTASRTRPTYRAPPLPDLVLPARRSWLEASLSRHRDTNHDDGSTVLGRRVAARAAAGGGNPSNSVPELEQIFLTRTAEIARDLETAVNRLASHRAAQLEQRVNEALQNASSRASAGNNGGGAQANEGVSSHMAGPFPSRLTNNTRRWRFGQTTGGTGLQSPGPSELADPTPSNPDVSTVTATFGPRPRRIPREQFDSPLSDSVAAAVQQSSTANHRGYLVRRRLNADGDEQVHNINLMQWDDNDEVEWVMPPITIPAQDHPNTRIVASTVSRNRLARSSSSLYPSPGAPRDHGLSPGADQLIDDMPELISQDVPSRRRGWARLDADGNEITTDEEDEIEHVLAQSRVRALAQVRASASSATPTLSPMELGAARRETLVPMTRTSITHVWDDDDEVTARVRINSPRQTAISPLTTDANGIASETSTSAHPITQTRSINRSHRSFEAFVADPLPMPLVDMMPRPRTLDRQYPRTVKVHKYANLAGR